MIPGTVHALVSSHAPPPAAAPTEHVKPPLDRIPLRKQKRDRYKLFSPEEVFYFFLGSAVARRLIQPLWTESPPFRSDRVYARTGKGVFLTRFRSFSEARGRLDPGIFVAVHQSLLVNIQRIAEVDLPVRSKQIGVALPGGLVEWIAVSKRSARMLRLRLGL